MIYINDLNRAVTFSCIRHFADDANIIYSHKSIRKINQRINYDLRNIVVWLRTNRIALNTDKAEIVLFRRPYKPLTRKMNFRISGQKIKVKTCAKCLGVITDEFINWKPHYNVLRNKLERSIGLISKLRYFVSTNLLRTVYFAIFYSYLHYGCQVWGQSKNASTKKIAIQDKALRIISFKDSNATTGPLYHEKKMIKFFDLIFFYNCLLIVEHLKKDLSRRFSGYFTGMANLHNHNTRSAIKKLVNVPYSKTSFYGTCSFTAKSVKDRNNLQNKVVFEFNQKQVSTAKLVSTLKKYFLASYSD